MTEGTYEYTKPAEVKRSGSLRLTIDLHEADKFSKVPGGLHASISLVDDEGHIVVTRELGPADLADFEQAFAAHKRAALEAVGAVFTAAAEGDSPT